MFWRMNMIAALGLVVVAGGQISRGQSSTPETSVHKPSSVKSAVVLPGESAGEIKTAVSKHRSVRSIQQGYRARRPKRKPATSERIHKILSKKLISVDYNETSLADVIRDLRDRLAINILVYWPSLRAAGFWQSEPITLKLDNVSAGSVVEAVLRYVSGDKTVELDYKIDRGVLEINRADQLVRRRTVKVYYVGDLLGRPSRYDTALLGALRSATGRSRGAANRTDRTSRSSGTNRRTTSGRGNRSRRSR